MLVLTRSGEDTQSTACRGGPGRCRVGNICHRSIGAAGGCFKRMKSLSWASEDMTLQRDKTDQLKWQDLNLPPLFNVEFINLIGQNYAREKCVLARSRARLEYIAHALRSKYCAHMWCFSACWKGSVKAPSLRCRLASTMAMANGARPWKIRPATKQDVPSIVWMTQVRNGVLQCHNHSLLPSFLCVAISFLQSMKTSQMP